MNDASGVIERIRGGGRAFGVFLNLGSRAATSICAGSGLDWVLVDLEHGSGSEATLVTELDAARSGAAAVFVRVESGERLRSGRALDLGADGIMIPRLERGEDVQSAVANLRFPPSGRRGVALMTPAAGFGRIGVAELVNTGLPLAIIQIESREAVERADEIADLDGVDVLFVGPADLSTALGQPGRLDDPAVRTAMKTVVAACDRNDKAAGILLGSAGQVPSYLDMGFRFIGIGSDASHLAAGVRGIADSIDGWRNAATDTVPASHGG